MNKRFFLWIPVTFLFLFLVGCGVYSFTGASIDPGATTVNILPFENKASYVNPSLAQQMTDDLRTKVTSQGGLTQVNSDDVDYIFKSTITGYSTSTVAVTNVEQAATARLTVTVSVDFQSRPNPDDDFTQSFSRSEEFSADQSLQQVEESLMEEIRKQIIDDIFNRAFVNW